MIIKNILTVIIINLKKSSGNGAFLAPLSPPESVFTDFNRCNDDEFDEEEGAAGDEFGGQRKSAKQHQV